jgi:hypothetical protein
MSVDSRLTAFLLLVSGNLIRLDAVNGSVALAVDVGAAISPSPSVVGVAGAFSRDIAGSLITPVLVFRTKRELHWEFLRLWTGFELPSSWRRLPCYGASSNRNILDFMRWPHIDLGAQDLNDIQRPKSFQTNSWK